MSTTSQKSFVYQDYKILQLLPGAGYLAVYAHRAEDSTVTLVAEPVDFIGLARERSWRVMAGSARRALEHTDHIVVGVIIAEGYEHITHEDENFAGLCRVGDDIREAIGCLHVDYVKDLVPPV